MDEFQIAGITTNTKFLSYILNTNEFLGGNYDINFIDNLNYHTSSTDKLSSNNNEHEIAASVLAVLIKTKKKSAQKVNSTVNNNNWWEQNYE